MTKIRQPIVTVAGHVDHGKTSILDKIRQTKIQQAEAGGITQKISFTTLPKANIQKRAGAILKQFQIPLEIPGLLFIDTPGHAAFTNLRKEGELWQTWLFWLLILMKELNPKLQR